MSVNEKSKNIALREFMETGEGWGHEEGHEVFLKLLRFLKKDSAEIYNVSLKGVDRTDVSFPRESVISIAKQFKKQKWFCISDASSESLIENWDAAAEKMKIPLIVWNNDDYRIIGLQPPKGTLPVLVFVLKVQAAATSDIVKAVKMKVANVSNKLKRLYEDGFLVREERVAESGGIEFEYTRVK